MAFIDDFRELCQQTIIWRQKTGTDDYNKPTYADPVEFSPDGSPRYGGRRRLYLDRAGAGGPGTSAGAASSFLQLSEIILLATPPIGKDDLVYVEGDTTFPPIIGIDQPSDETGLPVYTKITFGSAA